MATPTPKVALITGVTGQDGSYLSDLLLAKGYIVHGIKRRASSYNHSRLEHLLENHPHSDRFFLHYGDLLDYTSLTSILQKVRPDEVYNLAAQSHVAVSFHEPGYTAQTSGIGVLTMLEAIRASGLTEKVRFYQASTSELYGKVMETPQSETTPFYPRSPYGVAKLYGFWITKNYRWVGGVRACSWLT